jgi:hypothetical protein
MTRERTEAEKQNSSRGRQVAAAAGRPAFWQTCDLDVTDRMVFTRERSITEVTSSGHDDDRTFIGSSAFSNDPSSTGLRISGAPSALNNPYLFQLCGIAITSFEAIRIRGLRTYVDIRGVVGQYDQGGVLIGNYPVVLPVTSPLWTFPDGFASFHLRFNRGPMRTIGPVFPRPGVTNNIGSTGSALIYQGPNPAAYQMGRMVGDPIGSLGTVRDQRFAWGQQGAMQDIDYVVQGPGVLILYAAIKQTDPTTRVQLQLPPGFDIGSLGPEDRFVYSMSQLPTLGLPGIQYGRVAGSIIGEIGTIERRPGIERVTGDTPSD